MHDPETQIIGFWSKYHTFILWHRDPCKDGSDDSCGWFMRGKHGDKKILEKIKSDYEFEWDRTYEKYSCGWFHPDGAPHLSVIGITINMFLVAGCRIMGREKTIKYMNNHIAEILIFAENTVDSLHDGITRKFEIGCKEKYTPQIRNERLSSMASCIYGWYLRDLRPWYKHPRWHIWHWRVTFKIHAFKKKEVSDGNKG